ncbi:uncharacterized protein L203_105383 [Cryptococcus depauperatus CBS 7841]|uniref:Uncharacterized protein n=1 Tax=Cryptococcus depauperatus CBS 7841 TaxID=1295531 RepID=A0A1E3IEK1_9TREE|nr:poly(A)-binding protein binding protein [Cryptococcus depauperatus CBS 7841]
MSNERGRGRGGNRGGRGGMDGGTARGRGAWRNGPPVSRGGSPAMGHSVNPRMSIDDHMSEMKVVNQAEHKGFATDADISRSTDPTERELQPWVPDAPTSPRPNGSNPDPLGDSAGGKQSDFETFGTSNIPWDQFEVNERLFGAKTDFKEEIYTTRLNKSGPDFQKREKEAERLAKEIMSQTSKNAHVAEERGQNIDTRDEEEKYSGVTRAPNAYIPPSARRAAGQGAIVPRASGPNEPKANGKTPPPAPASTSAPAPVQALTNSTNPTPLPPPGAQAPVNLSRSTSDEPVSAVQQGSVPMKQTGSTVRPTVDGAEAALATGAGAGAADSKKELSGVVNQWRQFVGTERERVEAKKQFVLKSEKDRQLADLKKFQASFKVPLPMPKDILPILAKDEQRQKDIEARAASAFERAKQDKEHKASLVKESPTRSTAGLNSAVSEAPKPAPTKGKITMKIPEIPPFNPNKRKPPHLPVAETAGHDIKLASVTSPTPSNGSLASTKLNPNAGAFVFKPRPDAVPFKPSQTSSPALSYRQSQNSPMVASSSLEPSTNNLFFRDKLPEKIHSINPREDFNPWKHGPVPTSSTVGLSWPYAGRKLGMPPQFMSPAPTPAVHVSYEEDMGSPSPHHGQPGLMPGMPPNYQPYRFQPGISPSYGVPVQSPMFSPGPQFTPHPNQPMNSPHHMLPGGHQSNRPVPMYYQNVPPNHSFVTPQHIQQYPHAQRHGPPGPGGPGPMFYPNPNQMHGTAVQNHPHLPYPGPAPAHGQPGPGGPGPSPVQPQFQPPPPNMQMSPAPTQQGSATGPQGGI